MLPAPRDASISTRSAIAVWRCGDCHLEHDYVSRRTFGVHHGAQDCKCLRLSLRGPRHALASQSKPRCQEMPGGNAARQRRNSMARMRPTSKRTKLTSRNKRNALRNRNRRSRRSFAFARHNTAASQQDGAYSYRINVAPRYDVSVSTNASSTNGTSDTKSSMDSGLSIQRMRPCMHGSVQPQGQARLHIMCGKDVDPR